MDDCPSDMEKKLTPEQYRVTRCGGTEPPFTGKYYKQDESGMYGCVCCGVPLFSSNAKYDSKSGWPSFWAAVDADALEEKTDTSRGMTRTEVVCKNCRAHLGHVFPDGPKPSGIRYCINSASLQFTKR